MIAFRAPAVCALALALGACASTRPPMSPAQLDVIESRPIEAPPDAAFRAAAGVMLDRGLVITLSDRSAGLVGGSTWIYGPIVDGAHHPGSLNAPVEIIAWVRPDPAGRSILRAQFAKTGIPAADADQVSRFAEEVGARALIAAAPRRTP